MSTVIQRPTPRHIFLSKERQPLVYFYTSNLPKYLQARIVFETAGLVLHHFKSKKDPYSEDYSVGKNELLARAIREILGTVGAGSLFFVEDTSLRIEVLSTNDDFPGLAVKEWFPTVSFEDIDLALRKHGNKRTAVVKSDVALHVPGLTLPVYFHGETTGQIPNAPPAFEENRQYPWLTPNTFNGWLIPKGATKRLGEMTLEESWRYDFRIQALERMIDRLEEYTAVLNAGGQTYRVRFSDPPSEQLSLLAPQPTGLILIVVGRTCAGKTTFAEYARNIHDLCFIEASSVVRMLAKEARIEGASAFSAARQLLERQGPDIVARKMISLYAEQLRRGAVISGFRTIEELEVIKVHYPDTQVVVVEANERVRFERFLNRDRNEGSRNLKEFRQMDSEQWSFGLVRVAEDFADVRIVNEGSMEDYYRAISTLIKHDGKQTTGLSTHVKPRVPTGENQLFRCLGVLEGSGRPLNCDEIQIRTTASGHPVRHNNANKVLKRAPELARRLESEGTRVRYEITNAGRAYLRYMEAWMERSIKKDSGYGQEPTVSATAEGNAT